MSWTGGIRTTDQAFGEKLHTYTIVDAINDHNVLPFRIDYIKTIRMKDGVKDKDVTGIDKENALSAPERISAVVSYIIEHFDQKTKRNTHGSIELRSKKQLIEEFIAQINTSTDIQKDWLGYIAKKREAELSAIIAEQKLKPEETKAFVENAFRDGTLRTTGTDIDRILPPVSRFGGGKAGGNRSEVKKTVVDRLRDFFEKYFGV